MNLKIVKLHFVVPIFALIILGLVLTRLSLFTVQKVVCQLDQYPCPLNLEPALVNFYQQNIFSLTRQQVITSISAYEPGIAEVKIIKKLPGQLFITVKRRQPIAQVVPYFNLNFIGLESSVSATLSGEMTNQFFQLDKSGEIFLTGQASTSLLPLVAVPEDFNFNLKLSPASQKISQLIQSLQEHYVSFIVLAWLNESLAVVKTSYGSYGIINPEQGLNSQIASLQFILSGFKIGDSLPKKIDLRFDKPVLTF